MPLTESVWPQFSSQVFGGAVSTPVLGEWVMGGGESELVPPGSGQATLFGSSASISERSTV